MQVQKNFPQQMFMKAQSQVFENIGDKIVSYRFKNVKQKHDPLHLACIDMSIIHIKYAIMDFLLANRVQNIQELLNELDNLLLYCPFIKNLRQFIIQNSWRFYDVVNAIEIVKRNKKFFDEFVLNSISTNFRVNPNHFALVLQSNPIMWSNNDLFLFIKYEIFRFNINGKTTGYYDEISNEFANMNGTQFIHCQNEKLKKLFSNDKTFIVANTIKNDVKFICEKSQTCNKIMNIQYNDDEKKVHDDDNGNNSVVSNDNKDNNNKKTNVAKNNENNVDSKEIYLKQMEKIVSVSNLRKEMKKRNLKSGGNKEELLERLSVATMENKNKDNDNNLNKKNKDEKQKKTNKKIKKKNQIKQKKKKKKKKSKKKTRFNKKKTH